MNVKQQVQGLNEFLTSVYGADMRLSTLLTELGFTGEQVKLLRNQHLETVLSAFFQSIQERMIVGHDGKRLYTIITRRFGLDGDTPDTLEYLGNHFGVTRERIRQLEAKAIKQWKTKKNQKLLKTNLHTITLKLIGEITEQTDSMSISAKLERLAEIQKAQDLTRADYKAKREEIMSKVQSELEALDAEYSPLLQVSSEYMEAISAEIKNDVLRHGHSIKANGVQAVYYKGRSSWDSKGLSEYAEKNPEILEYQKQGNPVVTIRFIRQRA